MAEEWLSREELVEAVRAEGTVSTRQVERWHKEDLLPRPRRFHLGKGQGTRSAYPPGTLGQLRALLRLRKATDDTDTLRVLLWLADYPMPLTRIRDTLQTSLAKMFGPLLAEPTPLQPEEARQKAKALAEGYEDRLARGRGSAVKALRTRLPQADERTAALTALFTLVMGGPWTGEVSNDRAAKAIGIPDEWQAVSSGDEFEMAGRLSWFSARTLYETLISATDDEIQSARPAARLVFVIAQVMRGGGSPATPPTSEAAVVAMVQGVTPEFVAMTIGMMLRAKKTGFGDNVQMLVNSMQSGQAMDTTASTERSGTTQ